MLQSALSSYKFTGIKILYFFMCMLGGPRHGASSGCGWRVAAHILNKQSRISDKGWSPMWGLGVRLITPHRKK
jgi:hypothetical protein